MKIQDEDSNWHSGWRRCLLATSLSTLDCFLPRRIGNAGHLHDVSPWNVIEKNLSAGFPVVSNIANTFDATSVQCWLCGKVEWWWEANCQNSRWWFKMRIQDEDSRWGFKLTLRMKSQDENSRWGFKLENTMRIQIDIHDENWRWRFEMRIQDEAEASSHTHISITRNTTKRATDISRIRSGFLTTLSRNLQRIKSMNLCWHVPVLFKYLNQCKVNNGIGNRSQGRILAGDQ